MGLRPFPRELLAPHVLADVLVFVRRVHFDSAIAAGRYPSCVLLHTCFELPLRSSLEGVSQERMSHCSLIAGCQEVSVRPMFLLALTGETYWLVLCSRILSRRAHVPLNRIGMLQICYERVCS